MYGQNLYGANLYGDYRVATSEPARGSAGGGASFPSSAKERRLTAFTPSRSQQGRSSFASVAPSLGQAVLSPYEFSNEWLYGLRDARHFILTLTEKYIHKAWPVAVVAEPLMYIKNQVAITGTEASPETFTTSIGKLATMETGAPFPTFNDVTHVFHVSVNGAKYQSADIAIVKDSIAVVGGNIQFQAYINYGGNAASDGNYYMDVAVFLQAI